MSPEEALIELELESGASLDAVRKAYRRRAKATHPDTNPGDPKAVEKFMRVQAAYHRLEQHLAYPTIGQSGDHRSDNDEARSGETGAGAGADDGPKDAMSLVRHFMEVGGVIVLADGFLHNINHIKRPETPAQFHQKLLQPEVSMQSVIDDIMLDPKWRAVAGGRANLTSAVKKLISIDAKRRTSAIFAPLLRKLGPTGHDLMLEQLVQLASMIFKGPAPLIAHGLVHFIWQVHRKMMGYEVQHHLMPVIWSLEQGTGKSTFARRFCSPLEELFSPPITFDDWIDTRFSGALDYAVLFVDEIPLLTSGRVDAAKQLITAEELLRRQVGTPKKLRVRQGSSAIGTANRPPEQLFNDPSGHRRLLSIEMVDGRNDAAAWEAIRSFDYERLWRVTGCLDSAPILPILNELRAYQAHNTPKSPLFDWLTRLDFDTPELKGLKKFNGFKASDLRELFTAEMGLAWTVRRFSDEMGRYFEHPLTPFGGKSEIQGNTWYSLKPAFRSA
jgi:hypothetical protein